MSDLIVEEHKKLVIMTGNLSDFQLNNLKKWPFIIFDKALKKVTIDYDFAKQPTSKKNPSINNEFVGLFAGKVIFNFDLDEAQLVSDEDTKNKLAQLTNWVKYLFWINTEIIFLKRGKLWEI